MRSEIFKDHGFPDADYDFDVGRDNYGIPMVNFRAPGRGLQMIDLNGASQIKQKFLAAGDAEAASLFDRLIKEAQRGLVSTAPLYVDASRAAEMDHGARTDRFISLQEAKDCMGSAATRTPRDRYYQVCGTGVPARGHRTFSLPTFSLKVPKCLGPGMSVIAGRPARSAACGASLSYPDALYLAAVPCPKGLIICPNGWPAESSGAMPALSRRRDPVARQENWHVYYGYLHVGTISMRP